ncbi:MAG: YebC/PmpR family DNA-binding transcriptional regulator, partial [Deltaproteobacteria bacterium]|nr:YebC/PmpR family DNA-binding transcriptional regulator [Deltaproteobacteria bacterium]
NALTRHGGSLAGTNAVAYQFQEKGVLTITKDEISEEQLYDLALEAGAHEIDDEGEVWEVHSDPKDFELVKQALSEAGCALQGEVRMVPDTFVQVSGHSVETLLNLMEALDDIDDVQNVVANFDIDDQELQALGREDG